MIYHLLHLYTQNISSLPIRYPQFNGKFVILVVIACKDRSLNIVSISHWKEEIIFLINLLVTAKKEKVL